MNKQVVPVLSISVPHKTLQLFVQKLTEDCKDTERWDEKDTDVSNGFFSEF